MSPEKSCANPDRDEIRKKVDEEISQIQKAQFNHLSPELVEIVAKVATNGRMLKDINEIKKKAQEIDSQDDEISALYVKRYGNLMERFEVAKRRSEFHNRLYGWRKSLAPTQYPEFQLKTIVQQAELQINIAKALNPEKLDPEKIFTTPEWWKSSMLLEKIIWRDNPYKPRKIVTVPVNKKYL